MVFAVFELVAIIYLMAYARKVKADPTKSVLYGVDSRLTRPNTMVSVMQPCFIRMVMPRVKPTTSMEDTKATITMPIMAPTAELVGLSKQIAVMAYQFGLLKQQDLSVLNQHKKHSF